MAARTRRPGRSRYVPKTDSGKAYQYVVDLKSDAISCRRRLARCEERQLGHLADSEPWQKLQKEKDQLERRLSEISEEVKNIGW